MDIAGARALKERLGAKAEERDASRPPAAVHDDAPPVYRWTGVSRSEQADPGHDDAPADRGISRFLGLVPSFR